VERAESYVLSPPILSTYRFHRFTTSLTHRLSHSPCISVAHLDALIFSQVLYTNK
jgi:hypothetical protein